MTQTVELDGFDFPETDEPADEYVVVGANKYALGPEIERTPAAIANVVGRLVVARRVTKAGNIATMPPPRPFQDKYPQQPPGPSLHAWTAEREAYNRVMQPHVRAVNSHTEHNKVPEEWIPIPPAVGFLEQTANDSFFYIRPLGSITTSVIPYERNLDPKSDKLQNLYRLQIAEIV